MSGLPPYYTTNLPDGPGHESAGIPPQWTASPPSPFLLISVSPPIRSVLHLTNDVVRIESHKRLPNLWVRFWHRALLGWRWEEKAP
jgi:hypothetical protein